MYSRPKANESDEDLLKQQEQFMKLKAENKIVPAASVKISQKGYIADLTSCRIIAYDVLENETSSSNTNDQDAIESDLQAQLANTFEAIPDNVNIGNIIENISSKGVTTFSFTQDIGFPRAKRRDVRIIVLREHNNISKLGLCF